jgi:hypothetical protein
VNVINKFLASLAAGVVEISTSTVVIKPFLAVVVPLFLSPACRNTFGRDWRRSLLYRL